MLVGMVAIYSAIHFAVIQHHRDYAKRSSYEKVVTWVALTCILLSFIALMN